METTFSKCTIQTRNILLDGMGFLKYPFNVLSTQAFDALSIEWTKTDGTKKTCIMRGT